MKKRNKNKKINKSRHPKRSGSRPKASGKKKVKKAKKVVKKLHKLIKKHKKNTKKEKKSFGAQKKADVLTNLANVLIEKGRKRGFITYDEILKTFPDIENNILFLDELYEKFSIAGIDVLEGGNLLNLDIDLNDKDLNKGVMHDSIQMYLKEIGQQPSY